MLVSLTRCKAARKHDYLTAPSALPPPKSLDFTLRKETPVKLEQPFSNGLCPWPIDPFSQRQRETQFAAKIQLRGKNASPTSGPSPRLATNRANPAIKTSFGHASARAAAPDARESARGGVARGASTRRGHCPQRRIAALLTSRRWQARHGRRARGTPRRGTSPRCRRTCCTARRRRP